MAIPACKRCGRTVLEGPLHRANPKREYPAEWHCSSCFKGEVDNITKTLADVLCPTANKDEGIINSDNKWAYLHITKEGDNKYEAWDETGATSLGVFSTEHEAVEAVLAYSNTL